MRCHYSAVPLRCGRGVISRAFHGVEPHSGAVFLFSKSHGSVRCVFFFGEIVRRGAVRCGADFLLNGAVRCGAGCIFQE